MRAVRNPTRNTVPNGGERHSRVRADGLGMAIVLLGLLCPGALTAQVASSAPPSDAAASEGQSTASFAAQSGTPVAPPLPDSFGTPWDAAQNGSQNGSQNPAAGAPTPANDPPSRVVRVSVLNGNVSAEPESVNTFSPAELNQFVTWCYVIYTDPAAVAELEAGQLSVRLGGGTDLTVTAMTDALAQFGVASGSAHLRSYAVDPGTVLELDSPDAAVTVLQPGDVRVDVDPAAHTTTVALNSGQVQVDSPGSSQILTAGERLRIHGADAASGNPSYAESVATPAPDGLDGFSDTRDNQYASGADAGTPYLSADTVGGADLADYGSWDSSDAGPVWYPVVAVGWQPYCFGHWRWVAPWGWTWVGVEPWAFAPFHYGRWAHFGEGPEGRWGWIPGPRVVRPVYAPALVVFSGGPQLSASLGYAAGQGVAAWFPLGPHEPYTPWYHGSTLYLNRVNASNLYDANAAEVQGFYNQRAVNVFAATPISGRSYADRGAGTVAVPQNSFAAGRSVNNSLLHLPAETLAAAPLLAHPAVTPERSMLVPRTAVAMPPVLARPVLSDRAADDPAQLEVSGTALFHRADPPSARPSFDQQRQAMQSTEPGRPLSPAQMETLRPAGTPAARQHPAVTHAGGQTKAPPPPPSSAHPH